MFFLKEKAAFAVLAIGSKGYDFLCAARFKMIIREYSGKVNGRGMMSCSRRLKVIREGGNKIAVPVARCMAKWCIKAGLRQGYQKGTNVWQ